MKPYCTMNLSLQSDSSECVVVEIHLVKVNKVNLTQEEIQSGAERFEIQCRSTIRSDLQDQSWDIETNKVQDLKLENGLVDVAHWCLKYELEQNYAFVSSSPEQKYDPNALTLTFPVMMNRRLLFCAPIQVPYV